MTDFSKVTPCGGNCETCGFFHDGGGKGCRENGVYKLTRFAEEYRKLHYQNKA